LRPRLMSDADVLSLQASTRRHPGGGEVFRLQVETCFAYLPTVVYGLRPAWVVGRPGHRGLTPGRLGSSARPCGTLDPALNNFSLAP
jgi:hypothetical protein